MFKNIILIFALFSFGFFTGCDEIPPDVSNMGNMGGSGGGTVDEQERNVLIEEFTGVRCVNCPDGSKIIENLKASNGERLVAISIHAGFFSKPYPENTMDLRIDEGTQLLNLLGPEGGYPSASINRTKLENDEFLLDKSTWAGYIAQEAALEPKVKIDLKKTYNEGSRTLDLDLDFYIQEDITDALRYSVMITEGGIVNAQLTPESSPDKDLEYVHNHVLRHVGPSFDGAPIEGSPLADEVLNVKTSLTLDSEWVAGNCEVIIVAHLGGGPTKVLQVVESHVLD